MNDMFKIVLAWSVVLFTACGGGGSSTSDSSTSSDSLTYTGKTTAADLDEVLVQKFIKSLDITSSNNDLDVSNDVIQKASNTVVSKTSGLVSNLNKQVNGTVSGSVNFTTNTISSVKTEIIALFDNYNDGDDETLNGEVTYVITANNGVITAMTMTFKVLQIKDNDNDISMSGVIDVVDNSGIGKTFTQNIVLKNNEDDSMMSLEDFVIVFDENDRELSYSGKVYDSELGYVVVSTAIELSYNENGELNAGGEIHYQGKDSTIIEKSAYDNTVRLEVDEGSNGTVDKVEIYDSSTFTIIPNREPVISISFPQSIYTDTDMSQATIDIYDPDLDAYTTEYEWSVNNSVKSSSLSISTELFKKHETLNLKVMATDDREGDVKIGSNSTEQIVLNSRPVLTDSFSQLTLEIGESKVLEYSVSDADDDEISIAWKHYNVNAFFGQETIDEYYAEDISCSYAIQEYDSEQSVGNEFSTLSLDEQEDFQRTWCNKEIPATLSSITFMDNKTFTARGAGLYFHEMIISDGDYNRTKVFDSNISTMDLLESQENNHEAYTYNESYNTYMKDFDNDGNKDLIYVSYITREEPASSLTEPNGEVISFPAYSYEAPILNIELRNGGTVLETISYELNSSYALKSYHLEDLNGDEKQDIVFVYDNSNDSSDKTSYGKILQESNGTLGSLETFTLDNRLDNAYTFGKVFEDVNNSIVLVGADNYTQNGKVYIYSNHLDYSDKKTLNTELENSEGSSLLPVQVLVNDFDDNGKNDLLLVNKSMNSEKVLTLTLSILSQDNDGNFTETLYEKVLNENIEGFERIEDVVIGDFEGKENQLIVTTGWHIYILNIENEALSMVETIDFKTEKNSSTLKTLEPVDINHDGKKDLLVVNPGEYDLLSIFIQDDDFTFYTQQDYPFDIYSTSHALGDLEDDGKYELFFSTGEDKLSSMLFK